MGFGFRVWRRARHRHLASVRQEANLNKKRTPIVAFRFVQAALGQPGGVVVDLAIRNLEHAAELWL